MTKLKTIDFSAALTLLKEGKKLRRTVWNDTMYIALQILDKGTRSYIYIVIGQESIVSWLASQDDLLSNDWVEFIEK